jgi:hypothetical protein
MALASLAAELTPATAYAIIDDELVEDLIDFSMSMRSLPISANKVADRFIEFAGVVGIATPGNPRELLKEVVSVIIFVFNAVRFASMNASSACRLRNAASSAVVCAMIASAVVSTIVAVPPGDGIVTVIVDMIYS